jgi:hypothetical protein
MHASSAFTAGAVAAVLCFVVGVTISAGLVRARKVQRIQWRAGIIASLAIGAFVFAMRSGWF